MPYWDTNLIRHNLDVMYIKKHVFDNIFNTMMDVNGKTKDNLKVRKDMAVYCDCSNLELRVLEGGKILKPKAPFTLIRDQKKLVCE